MTKIQDEKKRQIQTLESIFNTQLSLMEQLDNLLQEIEDQQAGYQSLLTYYDSSDFLADVTRANRGEFSGIPCGILSEDGIFNLIFERRQLAERLPELANLLTEN